MPEPLLEVEGLHAGYGELTILHGVDLTVQPGERALLFGPNGSGKSTLLKALVGLVDVTGGTVLFAGERVAGTATERIVARGLAMVPQIDNVFRNLTVQENLELGGILERSRTRERIRDVLALFPLLADRRREMAGNLSGGERQLVAIGRALMIEPRLLLLDEPTAGLTPRLVSGIFEHVRRVNEERGVAILLVEQNVRQALPLAERAHLLEGGTVRVSGTSAEVARAPQVRDAYLGLTETAGAEPEER
jgi:ABC-type branched-subunit amino acid transport system ATPase component